MLLHEDIRLILARRQELRIWLLRQPRKPGEKRLTLQALADALNIRLPTLISHLDNPTMPVKHHRILRERFDIPVELLPEPMDLSPGPRPKAWPFTQQQI